MPNSIHLDRQGPDWPLGLITVAASGTPINIMSVVDSGNVNAPGTSGATSDEYTVRAYGIIFTAVKSVAPIVLNTGAIYITRKGVGSGTGNKADSGAIVAVLQPGVATALQTFTLLASPLNREIFSPYRYSIDADTNADGCLVTLLIM